MFFSDLAKINVVLVKIVIGLSLFYLSFLIFSKIFHVIVARCIRVESVD